MRSIVPVGLAATLSLVSLPSSAAPAAHLLRIDPEASVSDGHPVITTVLDLSEPRRTSELLARCARLRGDEAIDCSSEALEARGALWSKVPFDPDRVLLTVQLEGRDFRVPMVSHARWGELTTTGIGTAWLVIFDADAHGTNVLDEFARIAERLVLSMGKNDVMNVVVLGDAEILSDTRWRKSDARSTLLEAIKSAQKADPSPGRTRPLLSLVERAAEDAFRALGGTAELERPPLHQALVLLSTGFGGGDPKTTGPGAEQLRAALTEGRRGDQNAIQPKTPIPILSISAPPSGFDEHRQLAREFMTSLANPEIGGFLTMVRDGQPDHSARIVDAIRARFAEMIVAKFRLSCLAPTLTQSFSLSFRPGTPNILGDASFKNVPLGIDPSAWPLDIDAETTRKAARESENIFPGGSVKIFGQFCWGGDTSRAEAYFLPPGEVLPRELGADPLAAKKDVQKRLIALDMRATATNASDDFVEFRVPDQDNVLHGEGENAVVRLVVFDRALGRSSGMSDATVLSLRARPHPTPLLPIALGSAGALLGLAGLGVYLSRSNKAKARPSVAPPSRIDGTPYATPAPVTRVPRDERKHRAVLAGPGGRFVLLAGSDLRVGRDGARCAAVLPSPHVSGLHATFRFEDGRVSVRDEGSSSGTRVDGKLLEAGRWAPLESGAKIGIGPEVLELTVSES